MTEDLKVLLEAMKKESAEQSEKINALNKALELAKVEKDSEILIAKINALGETIEGTHSVDYLKGFHDASTKYSAKINAINDEIKKLNGGIPPANLTPPQDAPKQFIRTPHGMVESSKIDQSMLAVRVGGQQPEVK